jgi:hypothetical protein
MSIKIKIPRRFYIVSLSFCVSLFISSVAQSADEIEVEADQRLKEMSTYIAGLKQFTVSSHSTIESMLDSGQKIMLDHDNKTSVSRPNKLFSTRVGDAVEQSFYYDGKQFTIYSKAHNYYATVAAADNLTAALDQAINQFDLTAPGADLLYKDSYARLSKGLISGFYVGKSMIDGVECHHLAFRNAEVDWQIWIQTGDKPLPKRYVVSSRWITGSPQFSLTMTWDIKPDLADKLFQFIAPAKAEKIDLLLRGNGQ